MQILAVQHDTACHAPVPPHAPSDCLLPLESQNIPRISGVLTDLRPLLGTPVLESLADTTVVPRGVQRKAQAEPAQRADAVDHESAS